LKLQSRKSHGPPKINAAVKSTVMGVFDGNLLGTALKGTLDDRIDIRCQAMATVLPLSRPGVTLPHTPDTEAAFKIRKNCYMHGNCPFRFLVQFVVSGFCLITLPFDPRPSREGKRDIEDSAKQTLPELTKRHLHLFCHSGESRSPVF
jgi:hypothetical protein